MSDFEYSVVVRYGKARKPKVPKAAKAEAKRKQAVTRERQKAAKTVHRKVASTRRHAAKAAHHGRRR